MLPVIAITMGCPVGIGPEIIVRALADKDIFKCCRPVIIGDKHIMQRALRITGITLGLESLKSINPREIRTETAYLLETSELDPAESCFGRPTPETGRAMVEYIEKATELAISGLIQAIVTSPINKAAMHMAGYNYPGHTELLAEKTGTVHYAMMLAGETLRVVPVTIHVALRDVPSRLTQDGIVRNIKVTFEGLRRHFGLRAPRLAVCALNPHAGEGGLFGDEEGRIIGPAVQEARALGIEASGPYSADTIFHRATMGDFDAVLAMYHDQALIPLKLLHFKDGVNITLGLPIIRTSVDHGTAYDLAGTGKADPSSLLAAIRLAARMHALSTGKRD